MTVPINHEPEEPHAGRLIPDVKQLAAHAEQTLANIDELVASFKPTIATINRLVENLAIIFPAGEA